MAKRVIVEHVDDLDGTNDNVTTVRFTFDGTQYEIDLGSSNRRGLEEALAPYTDKARVVGGSRKKRSASGSGSSRSERERNTQVREWARSQGMQVGDKGKIPEAVSRRYELAHRSA